ncbi:hypothetical protein KIN20_009945 [Parelaphostrongylus tenuis]|uniref:Uncharacterized protein n=1 Tax=Parelaphostrongylus tenuis TaxID=148309 RepID=A0AAD5MYE0_PARTN|nr:hypothetical protein KIN20_009945 [Parelaphostrongylus tenuis]
MAAVLKLILSLIYCRFPPKQQMADQKPLDAVPAIPNSNEVRRNGNMCAESKGKEEKEGKDGKEGNGGSDENIPQKTPVGSKDGPKQKVEGEGLYENLATLPDGANPNAMPPPPPRQQK